MENNYTNQEEQQDQNHAVVNNDEFPKTETSSDVTEESEPSPSEPQSSETDNVEDQSILPITETGDVQDEDEGNSPASTSASEDEQIDSESVGRPQDDDDNLSIPEILPILPLKESVIYPFSVQPLAFGQDRYIRLVDDVMRSNRLVVLVAQKSPEIDYAGP